MTQLSRQQIEEMLKNKPANVTDEQVVQSLVKRGFEIEGLNLPSKKKAPNTLERVSQTVGTAGERIQQQIAGEGEFAGENAVVRGTGAAATAATAIPELAIQAVPEPLGGGLLRSGLQKAGEVLTNVTSPIINRIGDTALFRGAAGNVVAGPGGTYDYVPNDLGFLEDALKTTQNVGQVAEVTAGAGAAPSAVTNFATRTATAVQDVAREAIDRSLRATDNLAEKATPKSVRTIFRMNPPETRARAIDELEDAYKTGLVEDRKAINNRLEKLAAAESFGDVTVTRDSLIRDIAEEGYIPKIEGQFAKFDDVIDDINQRQIKIMEDLDNELAPLQGIENLTSLERMKLDAEARLRQSPQVGAGLNSSLNQLETMFKSLIEKYGPNVTPVQVNQIRKEMNRLTTAYKQEGGDSIFQLDTADAVGGAARKRLDELVPSGRVRQLNQEYARLERVKKTARILNNEIIEVGLVGRKLGSYVGTIGASLAGLQLAGPGGLVVASIFAQLGSDALATMLRTRKFDPKLREAIIKSLKDNPQAAERIIREASPENKKFLRNLIIGGAAAGGSAYVLSQEDQEGFALLAASIGASTITPAEKRVVANILEQYDTTPMTVRQNGLDSIDMDGADIDFRLLELKEKNNRGVFTDKDAMEARDLLAKRGALADSSFPQSATTKTTDLLEEGALPSTVKNEIARIRVQDPRLADEVRTSFNKATKEDLIDFMADMPDGIDPIDARLLTKSELLDEFLERADAETILDVPQSRVFSQTTENLLEEARKYPTPEEFIKAQGGTYYRGTTRPQEGAIREADTYGLAYGKGVYVTPDKRFAQSYGDYVTEIIISMEKPFDMAAPAPKSAIQAFKRDFPDDVDMLFDGMTGEDLWSAIPNADDANDWLKSLGYDGLKDAAKGTGAEQTIIFDVNKVKTRAQLEDIWKQANSSGATSNLLEEARKYPDAESFIEAQTFMYRGTRMGGNTAGNQKTTGVYLTPDEELAGRFGDVEKYYFDSNDLFDWKNQENVRKLAETVKGDKNLENLFIKAVKEVKANPAQAPNYNTSANLVEAIKKAGFKGTYEVEPPFMETANLNMFNEKDIFTEKQLVNLWDKAYLE